jgi:multidrug efflux pump
LSAGAGAEARRAIGWVIVGGMSLGTLLTLFVIPTIYTVLVRKVTTPGAAPESERPAQLPLGEQLPGSTGARH